MRGKLIVFEGIDGSGKSTQLARVRDWLSAHPQWPPDRAIAVTREPGATRWGSVLRDLLLAPERLASDLGEEPLADRAELLLYAADRAQHVAACLEPALARGSLVLCDRFVDSTTAYQGYGRGLDLELVRALNAAATGGLRADLTLWFDASPETALARRRDRGQGDRLERDRAAFHQRVWEGFRAIAQQEPERVVRVDANGSAAAVERQVRAILRDRLDQWFGLAIADDRTPGVAGTWQDGTAAPD